MNRRERAEYRRYLRARPDDARPRENNATRSIEREHSQSSAAFADRPLDLSALDADIGQHVVVETPQLLDGPAPATLLSHRDRDAGEPEESFPHQRPPFADGLAGIRHLGFAEWVNILHLHDHRPCCSDALAGMRRSPKQQPKAIVADALSGNAASDPFSRAISDRDRSIGVTLHLPR
jgi:hypothetical protein